MTPSYDFIHARIRIRDRVRDELYKITINKTKNKQTYI